MGSRNNPTIGIIEGSGTGPEVAEVFRRVVSTVYKKEKGQDLNFFSFKERFGYSPHTFISLRNKFYQKDYPFLKKIINKEVKDLKKFYLEAAKKNYLGIFRTAINAETLYYLRRILNKVKVVPLQVKVGRKYRNILFIRDQIQGYYTNKRITHKKGEIKIQCEFSQKNFNLLAQFVKEMTTRFSIKNYDLYFIYKFHLFGIELQKMIEKAIKHAKLQIKGNFYIFQPDTGMHKLLGELPYSKNEKDLIIVAGNEIGDVLLETLLHYYRLATKETFFTLNVSLFHAVDHILTNKEKRIEVLQTMHGSADDIAGKGILNPIATIRAAAYALENWLHIPNASNRMEIAIKKAIKNKFVTPDMGGKKKTMEVVKYILEVWK